MAAKSARSDKWFARLDGPQDFLRQKCKTLAEALDVVSCLGTFHTGKKDENPHCHIVIQLNANPQKQTFALRLKNLFSVEKRTQYALDVWDGNRALGAVSYLFHEENAEILVNKGFTDEDIEAAKHANACVQRVIAINKEKASVKFIDRAIEHYAGSTPTKYELLEYMMTLCKAGDLYWPGTFRAKQMIEEVFIKLSPNMDDIVRDFYSEMWKI